jgi:hypothetical protein
MIIGYLRNPHPPAADAGFAGDYSWSGEIKKIRRTLNLNRI